MICAARLARKVNSSAQHSKSHADPYLLSRLDLGPGGEGSRPRKEGDADAHGVGRGHSFGLGDDPISHRVNDLEFSRRRLDWLQLSRAAADLSDCGDLDITRRHSSD